MDNIENKLALPFLTRKMVDFEQGAVFSIIVDLIAQSTQAIVLTGLTKEGIFTYRIVPAASNNLQTFTFNVPDIPTMISLSVPPAGNPTDVNHVTAYLGVNTNRIALLCQGTISAYFGISWPNQHPPTAAQSKGEIAIVTGLDQAVGVEVADTVPSNQIWEVIAAQFTLVTSSTAANRTVAIVFTPADELIIRRAAGTVQTASQTQTYSFVPGGTNGVITANESQEVAIPSGIVLPPDFSISSVTTNIQTGDDFGPAIYIVRRTYQPATAQTLI